MMARRHMHDYGTTPEMLASMAVTDHYHGSLNPYAQFQREIPIDTVLNSPLMADPLRMFDYAPLSDGAAALILCPADRASTFSEKPVKIIGSGLATDSMGLHDRADITSLASTRFAAQRAYKLAGISPKEVDAAEVHDSFTIAEIIAYEDLGFAKKGEGAKLVREGITTLEGDLPVNPSGGLKACGHAVGATGIRQAVEIVLQLRGDAGKRQVDAETGLALNIGGTGGTAVVTIFGR